MILPPDMAGRTAAVVGLGKSGMATAAALVAAGARVLAWDDSADARGAVIPVLGFSDAARVTAPEEIDWSSVALLAMAPGVPLTHPEPHRAAVAARAAGVEIIGEVELLHRARVAAAPEVKILGITGSNGKSTTTALIDWILAQAGIARQCGGNLGEPSLSFAPLSEGAYVVELSSFQLDLVTSARFDAAVWLNTSPDHLDRHGDMDGYRAAKRRIFAHQQAGDWAIVGIDDPATAAEADALAAAAAGRPSGGPRVVRISGEDAPGADVFFRDGALMDGFDATAAAAAVVPVRALDQTDAPALRGRHNAQNMAAAWAVARFMGIAPATVAAAIRSFPGLAHRQEQVGSVAGVTFVNDSKATNAEATAPALAAYPGAYWIVGGKPKAGGIDALAAQFPTVAKAYLIGTAADAFAQALDGACPYALCGDLESATRAAFADAQAAGGGTVLLSPACASYDQFTSFEHRGDVFRALAQSLCDGATASGEVRP